MGTPGTAYDIAEELAKKQKEISVSEFFERNKQLLGFDSPTRAILTSVKEAVDNSLDACEEAGMLPEIEISLEEVNKKKGVYRLVVEDNGPGIVRKQIPNVFGRLLYGSRFHAIRQSRGQQGIGISAVVMYAQLTTGRPSIVRSKTGPDKPPHEIELRLDTKSNKPDVIRDEVVLWDEKEHGIRFETHLVGRYQRGKQSAFEYLRSTAIVNPHARLVFREPDGRVVTFHRATDKLPKQAQEIQPHPLGIMLGTMLKMARATPEHKLSNFLQKEFSRVSPRVAKEVCQNAYVDPEMRPADLSGEQAERMVQAFHEVKIMAPPTDCLSPIGPILIRKGLKKETSSDFIVTATRPPSVYSGNPFQVEVGLVYGGDLTKDGPIQILRFANRVPLLYQQGGCAITHALEKVNWRRYGLDQRGGRGIPNGPMMLMVHLASTKVPFTSESKEAIADDEEILAEVDRALREIGRRLQRHVKKKERLSKIKEKEDLIRQVLPLIAKKSASILDRPVPPIEPIIAKIMNMVLLNGEVEYDAKKKRHQVTIEVTNYTRGSKTFNLYCLLSSDLRVGSVDPKARVQSEDLLGWKVSRMHVGGRLKLGFEVVDSEEDDFSQDDLDLYVEGLDPELSNGVEAWDQDAYDELRRTAKGERPEGWVEVDDSAVVREPGEPGEVGAEAEGDVEDEEPQEEEVEEEDLEEEVEDEGLSDELDDLEDTAAEEEEDEDMSSDGLLNGLEEAEGEATAKADEDASPTELNGARTPATARAHGRDHRGGGGSLKVATVRSVMKEDVGREGPETPGPKAHGHKPRQSAIVDFDDEFRMEVSE